MGFFLAFAVIAASCSSSPAEEVTAAAQPDDRPTPQVTAPGQADPEPQPAVQQVEIKGRFGEACSDEGLCFEIKTPKETFEVCDQNGCFDHPVQRGESPPVMAVSLSLNGHELDGDIILACEQHSGEVLNGGGAHSDDDAGFQFFFTLPADTPLLEVEGVPIISQFEVISTLGVHQFLVTDYIDIGVDDHDTADSALGAGLLRVSEAVLAQARETATDKTPVGHTCSAADRGIPPEDLEQMPADLRELIDR